MNELPPFPISPLDDGKPPSRVPVASARVEVGGENWLLRPCNGLLFARRESRNEGDWTFAASKPLADDDLSAKRLGELWGDALRNRKVSRFVVFYADHISRELPLFFAEGGIGWMREFWNRDDFPFEWDVEGVLTRQLDEFKQLCDEIYTKCLMMPLYEWSEENPEEFPYAVEPLHFLCGSQEELEKICRLICWSDSSIAQSLTSIVIELTSESAFGRALVESLSHGNKSFERIYPDTAQSMSNREWFKGNAPPFNVQHLFELALEENTPVGLTWKYNDQGSGRASHCPETRTLYFSFPPPSMHEHLEARLQLREWLASRVSPEELATLLS